MASRNAAAGSALCDRFRRGCRGWWCLLLLGGVLGVSGLARAAELEEKIDAHLTAGEFGPAQRLAEQLPPGQRDASLQRIAFAQAAGGAPAASRSTAYTIADDRVRSGVFDQLGSQPYSASTGAHGGVTLGDFTPLMDLITATVAPTTWDTMGGPGTINPFLGGVYVAPDGLLQQVATQPGAPLAALRAQVRMPGANTRARDASGLRKISLRRLERELHWRQAAGLPPSDEMRFLAGVHRLQYVFLYPESGDVVLAGPAGDWSLNPEGRVVHAESGRPVLQLDDLIVVLRTALNASRGSFGCSITPAPERLAAVQAFCAASADRPLKPHQREAWLQDLRNELGRQEIHVFGVDPRTRAARVIVEADHHMKLVGLGLAEGTFGVTNYLDALEAQPDSSPPAMDVLRWWFTLNYDAVQTTPDRQAFAWIGSGVRVLSENELLEAQGKRVSTGRSDPLNSRFAHSFTEHFEKLAVKYPVYAELQNIFDLAVAAAVIRAEDLTGQAAWQLTHFAEEGSYAVTLGHAPREVESVINHRDLDQGRFVAAVSGGVSVDPRSLVRRDAMQVQEEGPLRSQHEASAPAKLQPHQWWWD